MGALELLAWSLLHFLWQGCLLGGLAWLALRLLKGAAPEARYAVTCLGLAAMVAAPVATGVLLRRLAPLPIAAQAVPAARSAQLELEPAAPATPALTARLQPALPWILGVWAAGVVLLSLRLLGGWVWMQRLRHGKASRAADEWQTLLRVLARRIGLARDVLLLVCDRIESPVALGWIRPVILIPPAVLAGLEPLALEAILLHELAHVRRQDYLVNLLQSCAETLLFYHPAVWWVSAVIRQERENACDDTAIRLTGDAVAYARTLSLLEEFRMDTRTRLNPTHAPAADGGSLIQRVRRILAPAPTAAPLAPRAAVLGLLAAGLLGAATVSPAPKESAPRAKEDAKPAEQKRVHKVVVMTDGAKEGNGAKLRLKLQGDAKLEDIRKDFSRMTPGSSIRITEKDKVFSAERNKEGAYTESYTVNGRNEPITGDVRTWAAGRLPENVRIHADHGAKVVVGENGSVVTSKDGEGHQRVIIVKKKGGEPGDEAHVLKLKHGGDGADMDMDFDFDFEPGDFTPGPEFEKRMEVLGKEMGDKIRIEMKEVHRLHPELKSELEQRHTEKGDGRRKTFVVRSGAGEGFTFDVEGGKEAGQKARMKAMKGLAGSLAKDADDPETKAALARIQAELEALEARTKK
ncbi:MAG: M56 family metallopeptidase [Holophagaceae bacterium]|nr:M56 family metallopeptidase [Holophagaceae bacterium]